jgi:AcrR family transcriptional regulator
MQDDKPSKREALKKNNRKQILQAALKVFGELGIDATHVRDIIRATGLSSGTFYNYFESKEEVFEVLLDEIIQDVHNRSRDTWKKVMESGDYMKQGFEDFFNLFHENPDYLLFFYKNQHRVRNIRFEGKLSSLLESLEHDMELAIQKGKIPPVPVKFMTIVLFGTVFEILAEMILHPGSVSIPEVSENLANFFRGGLLSLSFHTGAKNLSTNLMNFANLPLELIHSSVTKKFSK